VLPTGAPLGVDDIRRALVGSGVRGEGRAGMSATRVPLPLARSSTRLFGGGGRHTTREGSLLVQLVGTGGVAACGDSGCVDANRGTTWDGRHQPPLKLRLL
jgi:hypothetical protein